MDFRRQMLYRLVSIILVIGLLVPGHAQALIQDPYFGDTPTEPHTELYVVYSDPDQGIMTIELRDQRRLPNGDVLAFVSVRADSLIAYDLHFDFYCPPHVESDCPSSGVRAWGETVFLPLYPGRIYDLGNILIPAGSSFTIGGTKFGLEEDIALPMAGIQVSLLAIHLAGITPPIDQHELPEVIIEAFQGVIGPIGTVASSFSVIYNLLTDGDVAAAWDDLGQAVVSLPETHQIIADIMNQVLGDVAEVSTEMVADIFTAINIGPRLYRAVNWAHQMFTHPDLVTATITSAPTAIALPERYRVFEINEMYSTQIMLRNAGSEIWANERGYILLLTISDVPVQTLSLSSFVRPGEIAIWNVPQRAPPIPGIYRLGFQMILHGKPIGYAIPAEIVVVPENSGNLTALIEAMVANAIEEAGGRFDQFRADLERRIAEALIADIKRRLLEICGGTNLLLFLMGSFFWGYSRRKNHDDE